MSGASRAAEMQTRAGRDGNGLLLDGCLAVSVGASQSWQVLAGYGHLPAFVPGIHSIRVLAQEMEQCNNKGAAR